MGVGGLSTMDPGIQPKKKKKTKKMVNQLYEDKRKSFTFILCSLGLLSLMDDNTQRLILYSDTLHTMLACYWLLEIISLVVNIVLKYIDLINSVPKIAHHIIGVCAIIFSSAFRVYAPRVSLVHLIVLEAVHFNENDIILTTVSRAIISPFVTFYAVFYTQNINTDAMTLVSASMCIWYVYYVTKDK